MRPQPSWRILVEARKDPTPRDRLDQIADVIRSAGYHVVRWRGPLSGRVACSRLVWDCDVAFLWNATPPRYVPVLRHLRRRGTTPFFVELGWYPQQSTLQVDHQGINADASWCREPLAAASQTPLPVRKHGDLLVLLQHEGDTQITRQSPYFRSMAGFVGYLQRYARMPLRVRPHPAVPPSLEVRTLVGRYGLAWDNSTSLDQSLGCCRAVACINSSAAVAALAAGLPVLCFGQAIYRHPGCVYCLNADGAALAEVTGELAAGQCQLARERVTGMLHRIVRRQWNLDDLSVHVPRLLERVLQWRRPRTGGALSWLDRVRSSSSLWSTYVHPKLLGTP
jgi:hypothetical protein